MSSLCRRCGSCCREIAFLVDSMSEQELARARGLRVVRWRHLPAVIVPHVCPHLIGNDCELHGTAEFPEACRIYPGSGEDLVLQSLLIPECGYCDT
jgi:Fe-S-cluster containining protein